LQHVGLSVSFGGVATRAHGRILVWEGVSVWVLSAPPGQQYPRTDFHAHHAVQLTLALTGTIEFDGDAGRVSSPAITIAPDVRHAFKGTGCVAHVFVDPDGQLGRQLVRMLCSKEPIAHVPTSLLRDVPARLYACFEDRTHTDEELRRVIDDLIARVSGDPVRAARVDPRISKVIAWVASRLDESVSLGDVAAVAGLSEGRTRHLFVEQTGLSFKTFLLWLRLTRAVEMFADGASLTDAAHGAGFSDSAHLSRTFRRMFGITAASLVLS
jgi:AraC family transcriptional regulator